MQIVPYPHPALAMKSAEIKQIDASLKKTISRMFELMYEANGIGLAANQVGLPLRFFVINLGGRPEEADEEFVFINPVITKRRGSAVAEEGCLSLPGLYGDVRRPEAVVIEAFDLNGEPFQMELDELPARVVQHESDHLDGVMFTDRMREEGTSAKLDMQIPRFVKVYRAAQQQGVVRPDEEIQIELDKIASQGTVPASFLEQSHERIPVPELEEQP